MKKTKWKSGVFSLGLSQFALFFISTLKPIITTPKPIITTPTCFHQQ